MSDICHTSELHYNEFKGIMIILSSPNLYLNVNIIVLFCAFEICNTHFITDSVELNLFEISSDICQLCANNVVILFYKFIILKTIFLIQKYSPVLFSL